MKKLDKIIRDLMYVLPAVLFFSYFPVISLGANESMNFEFSLPLIWLIVFDLVGLITLWKRKILTKGLKGKWMWLLFPVWLSLSVLWSLNMVRGLLTVGILWLLYIAGYVMWSLKKLFDDDFRTVFWKWFFGSALVVCVWCFLQCVLDLLGVSQTYTLMCNGCTYHMFGFPHPNGFAIEPQFMGNLLLAPAIIAAWLILKKPFNVILFFIYSSTLFLTFSRGAIYAFVVALMFMSVFMIAREKAKKRVKLGKRVGIVWGVVVLSFLFTLNVQGVMAKISPTDDTYSTGVAKVLNHLSLGLIDIRGNVVENPVDNTVESTVENSEDYREEAAFDGYVAESTDTRLRLTSVAVKIWSSDVKTVLFGVGLGGAGQALYINDLSPAPKEIVQNEYASLLLETGIVGISLLILTLVLIIKALIRNPTNVVLVSLIVAYGITLVFFSGLPNALHIFLTPLTITMILLLT